MEENLKSRVLRLLEVISEKESGKLSVRQFCVKNDINYKSLYNAFKMDSMGIGLIDRFKEAVPELNMNWFLYGEGDVLLSQQLPSEFLKN